MDKTCSKCGVTFPCKADSRGCWCEGYVLDVGALGHLKDTFADCLCPDCLKGYEATESLPGAKAGNGG